MMVKASNLSMVDIRNEVAEVFNKMRYLHLNGVYAPMKYEK